MLIAVMGSGKDWTQTDLVSSQLSNVSLVLCSLLIQEL